MSGDPRDTVKTRASLVQGLQLGDEDRWQDFCRLYGPVIRGFALKAGLTETEADEVVQETTIAVARHVPEFRYDPEVCRFKTWLLNQALWRVKDQLKKRRRWDERVHKPVGGSPFLPEDGTARTATIERVADAKAGELESIWDEEWRSNLLNAALEKVKAEFSAKQFQIFDFIVLKRWSAGEVARSLGASLASVYLAKHRVAAAVRKEMARLERQMANR
jgi:RNA polymerase sigma-70 factor (ECF subfamily)